MYVSYNSDLLEYSLPCGYKNSDIVFACQIEVSKNLTAS